MAASDFDLDSLTPEGVESWDELFPFPDYREKQRQTMIAVVQALHDPNIDNVVVDGPTGTGKSAINVAAARSFDSSFYITPQKSLREQLQNDEVLSEYYRSLRSRRDYTCGETGQDCDSCDINKSTNDQCSDFDDCTYWNAKMAAIDHECAVLTFAYLVIDGALPPKAGSPQSEGGMKRISFADRDLLIVDEVHGLESQVASLFAGFKVSPWTVPPDCYRNIAHDLDMENTSRHGDVYDIMETLYERCRAFRHEHKGNDDYADLIEDCEKYEDNFEWFQKEVDEWGRDWVVDMEMTRHPDKNKKVKSFQVKPVKVDSFLKHKVWRRADTRLLTTATMPYRGNPDSWCKRIGLDPDRTHVIKVGMPFAPERRPIHLDSTVAKMSGGGDDDNWEGIMTRLNELAKRHSGENGLIHTASYARAERVYNDAKSGKYPELKSNVLFHDADDDTAEFIKDWQNSQQSIVVSPSMMEGVDLVDDMCRWQALLKVPYPNMGDSRVDYLMDADTGYNGKDWQWYNENTAQAVIQSVGRAVRSKDDFANYYVLDKSFNSIRNSVAFPDWFEAAITSDPVRETTEEKFGTKKSEQDPLDF